MPTGGFTGTFDVAQLTLILFVLFFAGLVYYLRREDKREGYPLDSDRSDEVVVQGFPSMPKPKTFLLRNGHTYQAPPGHIDERPLAAVPAAVWPGAPLVPTGNAMTDGVGASSYALREELPELTAEGEAMIAPLRVATQFYVEPRDPDPRGMEVVGADGAVAGTVTDLWIDRAEPQIRYLEVAVAGTPRTVLLPMTLARVHRNTRQVHANSVLAAQFADAPGIANPDQVTLREEDRIMAYFGGGHLHAEPSREEALI
jgi:photosynthetic reaction center H subunit